MQNSCLQGPCEDLQLSHQLHGRPVCIIDEISRCQDNPHTTATTTLMRAIFWLTRHIKPVELVQLKPAKGLVMLLSREDVLKALNDRIGQVNGRWVVLHAIIEVKYLGKYDFVAHNLQGAGF